MYGVSKQEKDFTPMEIHVPMKVFLRLLVALVLVLNMANVMGDGLGELSYVSSFVALMMIFGGVYLKFLSARGEVVMPLWFIALIVSLGIILTFNARTIISFISG